MSRFKQLDFLVAGALMLVFASYLALTGLDHAFFWDDEAEVGIIAKNFVTQGKLTAWDGRNLFAYHDGETLDQDLRPINPPLQYLVAAASFKLFGFSTWAGRFPFVLIGLGTLVLFGRVARREFQQHQAFWLIPFALLAFSVVFLLHIRQCRYYSLALFFSLLSFDFYRCGLRNQRWGSFVGLGLASALLFFSHYLICAAFLLALIAVHLVFYARGSDRKMWLRLGAAAGVFLVATLPYAVAHKVWVRPDLERSGPWLVEHARLLGLNLIGLNEVGLSWVVGLGLVIGLIAGRKDAVIRQTVWPWLVLSVGFVFFLSIFVELPPGTKEAPIRYLIPLAPFLAGLTGAFLWLVWRRVRLLAPLLFAALLACNALALLPSAGGFRWLLPAYVWEIHHPYPTCYSAVTQFLREQAPNEAMVFTTPEFCTYPLMFYAGDKARFGGLLDVSTHLPEQAYRKLEGPMMLDENFPDYLIAFGKDENAVRFLEYFSRSHSERGRAAQCQYKFCARLDVFWYDTSRPELSRHLFGPRTDFDPEKEGVYIFKRAL